MTSSSLTQLENSVDITVCVLLLQSQRLEITLTAFVTTEAITATGKDRNLCVVLNIESNAEKLCIALRVCSIVLYS